MNRFIQSWSEWVPSVKTAPLACICKTIEDCKKEIMWHFIPMFWQVLITLSLLCKQGSSIPINFSCKSPWGLCWQEQGKVVLTRKILQGRVWMSCIWRVVPPWHPIGCHTNKEKFAIRRPRSAIRQPRGTMLGVWRWRGKRSYSMLTKKFAMRNASKGATENQRSSWQQDLVDSHKKQKHQASSFCLGALAAFISVSPHLPCSPESLQSCCAQHSTAKVRIAKGHA